MHCDVVLLVVYIILRCHSSQTLTNLCCLAGSRSHSLASMANRFFKNGTTRQNEYRHLQSSSEEFTAAGLLTQAGVKYDNSTYIVFYASGDIGDQEIVHILSSIM